MERRFAAVGRTAGGVDADAGGGRGDAAAEGSGVGYPADRGRVRLQPHDGAAVSGGRRLGRLPGAAARQGAGRAGDRKSVVEGKSVSVRVDLGGRRTLNKKKRQINQKKKPRP